MAPKPILVEDLGRGRGIALGATGRFYRVRIPPGAKVGDELPAAAATNLRKAALIAAAAMLVTLGSFLVYLPHANAGNYDLVTLRFASESRGTAAAVPAVQPASQYAQSESGRSIEMTLALDREGTVAAVIPREKERTHRLVGMRVEQAIHHAVGQVASAAAEDMDMDVQVRPSRRSTRLDTAKLRNRIRTALPRRKPPIDVEIGPPAGELDWARFKKNNEHPARLPKQGTGD